ncbi:unnamed protein product [Onchocerca flexuosa]|uniref:Uncharacterized protein n=1 Tax=Onchocerca flexuosa TaxID=387005 RepID=A0A183H4V3_9BILA|nr:unnamed protein product [Onchocerca flexuosa]
MRTLPRTTYTARLLNKIDSNLLQLNVRLDNSYLYLVQCLLLISY